MTAEGSVLTARRRNRALLARQFLLERADLPVTEVLERMGFLQAQYAPSMYIGLWSRVRGFERAQLTSALEDRSVVQGTLLRATIHLVAAGDWWPASVAVRHHRRRWWLRAHGRRAPAEADVAAAADRVREMLAAGPQKRAAVVQRLGLASDLWNGVNLWLDLVRVPPSGTWEQRRADRYALAEDWIGPPPAIEEEDGLAVLLRRYLTAFGPASLRDAANWAGVPATALATVAAGMELRRFLDEGGRELVDLPDGPLPDEDTAAPVRFLPTWDAILLAHARGAAVLREEHRPRLFSTKSPQSVPSFLVDGQVAGTWTSDGDRIVTEPFDPLPARARRAVDAEAERLRALHR